MSDDVANPPVHPPSGTTRPPAVFLFQPHTFRRVTPARLAEWEDTMRQHFGLREDELDFDEQAALNGGSWSDSGPSGQICADDCDNLLDELDMSGYPADSEDLPELERPPAVFMLQPSSFEQVTSDRLAEWEQIMRDQVGLTTARFGAQAARSGSLSATLPNDCMDDSDYASE